jgi:acetyltransferase-like isoleucine patch superfamily enzyme
MNFIKRIKNKITYTFYKSIKPELIGGWLNSNGILSKNTRISNMTEIASKDSNLFIGDFVFINHFSYIDAKHANVLISNNVQICTNVCILTHSTHNSIRFTYFDTDEIDIKDFNQHYNVEIGEYTYIGPNSVIMPGTIIGKGCVISAFSYVKGIIPDYSIVRGQPGRVIGNTIEMDKKLLIKYPKLKDRYNLNNL